MSGDGEPARAKLAEVLEDPEWGREHLPRLLALLEHDDRAVRTGAAWALTLVADEYPDGVPTIARRLGERLRGDDAQVSVGRALDAVARGHPAVVEEALDGVGERHHEQIGPARTDATGVGATPETEPEAQSPDQRRLPDDADDDSEAGLGGTDSGGTTRADATPPEGPDDGPTAALLEPIVDQSQFDDVVVTGTRQQGRYGDVYRSRATVDGETVPVALLVFHVPAEQAAFARSIDDALSEWAAVDDHEHVLTLQDWGLEPRPWALAEYAGESVADRDSWGIAEAVWSGHRLASALAHVHERGVVHGGVDPENVVYYGNRLDDRQRRPPLVTNVAVCSAVRTHFDPTGMIDPRYAAPEYYDRRYGRIDGTTDIYQLGAVLYRLATGEHPFAGDYEAVRRAILDGDWTVPAAVHEAPDALGDVLRKAMATEKLRRYESAATMAADLRQLGGADDAG